MNENQSQTLKYKNKKMVVRLWVKLASLVISILLVVIAIFLIFASLGFFKKKETSSIYSYKISNDLNYQVFFKENDYLEEKSMGMNQFYISELVDYIEIDYSYLYSSSKATNLLSNYKINATIYGEYQTGENEEDSKIWSKKYDIVPLKKEKFDKKNQISYNPKINISLDKYQEEVTKFQKDLKLPMKTKLIVRFSSTVQAEEYDVNKLSDIEVVIPLNESVFTITTKYDKIKNNNVYDNTNNDTKNEVNTLLLTFSSVFTVIAIAYLYISIVWVTKALSKSKYTKTLNKIKRDYDELIVDLKEPIDLEEYKVIEVTTFEELMDLEGELRIPVLHYEVLTGYESWFVIIQQNLAYRYILNRDEE